MQPTQALAGNEKGFERKDPGRKSSFSRPYCLRCKHLKTVFDLNSRLFCGMLQRQLLKPVHFFNERELRPLKTSTRPLKSFTSLPNELIAIIYRFCTANDQNTFACLCKGFREVHKENFRFHCVRRIAESLSNPPIAKKNIPFALLRSYNSCTGEILIGQEIDYDRLGNDSVLAYDRSLQERDSLGKTVKSIFTKSIKRMVPANNGNAIIISGQNENKIVYWDRVNKQVYLIKNLGRHTSNHIEVQVLYNNIAKRIYLATLDAIEVYEESEGSPKFIERINLNFRERKVISWMVLDEDINKLYLFLRKSSGVRSLIEYDLSTKQASPLSAFPEQITTNIHYDKKSKWLLSILTSNPTSDTAISQKILVFDVLKNKIASEILIPTPNLYGKTLHYVPEKKWVFFTDSKRKNDAVEQTLMKWDIEQNRVSILDLEMPRRKPLHLQNIGQIDYDPHSRVLILKNKMDILGWDLNSGCLIQADASRKGNFLKGDFIWDKKSFTFITLDTSIGSLEVRNY